jgi:hypothetical protein
VSPVHGVLRQVTPPKIVGSSEAALFRDGAEKLFRGREACFSGVLQRGWGLNCFPDGSRCAVW